MIRKLLIVRNTENLEVILIIYSNILMHGEISLGHSCSRTAYSTETAHPIGTSTRTM